MSSNIDNLFLALAKRRRLDQSPEFNRLVASLIEELKRIDPLDLPADRRPLFQSVRKRICRRSGWIKKDQALSEDLTVLQDIMQGYSKDLARDDQLILNLLCSVRGIPIDLAHYGQRRVLFHKCLLVREQLVDAIAVSNGTYVTDYEIQRLTNKGEVLLTGVSSARDKKTTALAMIAETIIVGNVDKLGDSMTKQNISISGSNNQIGDVVAAETIHHSFNKVQTSELGKDLKAHLLSLHNHVEELVKQLPADQAKQLAGDLDTFSKEVSSPSPRRKWYELSGEGLIEAAKSVAEISGPVTATVKAILGLIGGTA